MTYFYPSELKKRFEEPSRYKICNALFPDHPFHFWIYSCPEFSVVARYDGSIIINPLYCLCAAAIRNNCFDWFRMGVGKSESHQDNTVTFRNIYSYAGNLPAIQAWNASNKNGKKLCCNGRTRNLAHKFAIQQPQGYLY